MKRALFTTALLAMLLICGGVVRGQYLFNSFPQSALSSGDEKVGLCSHPSLADSVGLYKFSAGLSINTFGGGPSIKYGISKNCVFQTDFSGKYFANTRFQKPDVTGFTGFIVYVYEFSQNFLFQHPFTEKNGVIYYYMIGAGVSGGITMFRPTLWKVGTYPLFGMEFVLKKPKLSFQVDIRAGYCALLKSANAKPPVFDNNPLRILGFYLGAPDVYPYHGYDISLNFAVRFCKIKN